MERNIIVPVLLIIAVLALGWVSNQMLLGSYAALLVIIAALGYLFYVDLRKKSGE